MALDEQMTLHSRVSTNRIKPIFDGNFSVSSDLQEKLKSLLTTECALLASSNNQGQELDHLLASDDFGRSLRLRSYSLAPGW